MSKSPFIKIALIVLMASGVLSYGAAMASDVRQKSDCGKDVVEIFRNSQAINNHEVIILSDPVGKIILGCCKNAEQGIGLLQRAGFKVHVTERNGVEIARYNKLYKTDKMYDQFVFSTRTAHLWQSSKVGQFFRFIFLFLPTKEYSVTLFINNGKIEKVFARADRNYLTCSQSLVQI